MWCILMILNSTIFAGLAASRGIGSATHNFGSIDCCWGILGF